VFFFIKARELDAKAYTFFYLDTNVEKKIHSLLKARYESMKIKITKI
jgi:hypothetical protein